MRSTKRYLAILLILTGCGDEGTEAVTQPPPVRELKQPELVDLAPTAIRVGERLSIMGKGFADEAIGETRITFEGVYQTTSGKVIPVNLEVVPEYENQGTLTFNFGPNIPFSSEEDTGFFRGVVKAKNVGLDGTIKDAPQAMGTEIQVLPSILIRQMRPLEAGCAAGLTDTIDNTPFLLELKAIGLRSGADNAPLRFVYTFMKEHFQFQGYLGNEMGMDPEALFPPTGPVSVVDDVTNGTISALGAGAPRNVYIYKGTPSGNPGSMVTGSDKLFSLTDLITAPVPPAIDSYDAFMNIVAVDSTGQEARRTIDMTVWTPVEVRYEGGSKVVQSWDPTPVSGCIHGSDVGVDVTYSEMTSETRERSFTTTSKVSAEVDAFVARLNAEFGIGVTEKVSSETAEELQISGFVVAGQSAVLYRQTYKLERRGKLIGHGPCGNTQGLGEVVVTDWTWAPDLAKGYECPPFPPSNLPPGQVFDEE